MKGGGFMTRQQMIDVIVTSLLITQDKKDKEDGTEHMLRRGFKGFDNFTDDELKQLIDEIEPKKVEGLLLCAELLAFDREDKSLQGQKTK